LRDTHRCPKLLLVEAEAVTKIARLKGFAGCSHCFILGENSVFD
jgi:hypothetical protein